MEEVGRLFDRVSEKSNVCSTRRQSLASLVASVTLAPHSGKG